MFKKKVLYYTLKFPQSCNLSFAKCQALDYFWHCTNEKGDNGNKIF